MSNSRKSYYSRSSSGRASSAVGGVGSGSSRPPVILQFEGESSIAGGFAGTALPKHILELPPITTSVSKTTTTSPLAAQIYFQQYAATVEKLLLKLGGGAVNRATARVVVLHTDLIVNRHWKLALTRILQDVCRVSAVHFQSILAVIPLALTPISPTLLTVHFSYTGFQCMVYAEHHLLEYTYQSAEYYSSKHYYYSHSPFDHKNQQTHNPRTVGDLRTLQNRSVNVLITALCLCLQQCPVSTRKAAIHNILLSGTVVVDNFGLAIAKKLRDYLVESSSNNDNEEAKEEKDEQDPQNEVISYTSIPVNKKVLEPLANQIGVLQSSTVCEQLAWIGASVWALQSSDDAIQWTELQTTQSSTTS